MTYRAIYAYPWDIADRGVPESLAEIAALGLDTVTVAGAYHAGKFLRPRAPRKVYFPDDGAVYFRPDQSRYGAVRPVMSALTREHDVLAELCEQGRAAVNVWLVLLHNTRLGTADPDLTVRNAFGDPYVYSLCPAAGAVRITAPASGWTSLRSLWTSTFQSLGAIRLRASATGMPVSSGTT